MALNKPVKKIAIVGTGVIGASWAAEFLAHGFDVVATDPAPNADRTCASSSMRHGPLSPRRAWSKTASRNRLSFTPDMKTAALRRRLCPGEWPGTARIQDQTLRRHRRVDAARFTDCFEFVRHNHERDSIRLQTPRTLRHRPSVQSPAHGSARRSGGRIEDVGRNGPARNRVLRIHRQETDSRSQRGGRTRRQSIAGCGISRGRPSHSSGRCGCRRCRHRCLLGPRIAMGNHGAQYVVPSWRRRGRNQALHGASVRPRRVMVEVFRLSWKWKERSSVKITERTHEEDAEALHTRRESRRP